MSFSSHGWQKHWEPAETIPERCSLLFSVTRDLTRGRTSQSRIAWRSSESRRGTRAPAPLKGSGTYRDETAGQADYYQRQDRAQYRYVVFEVADVAMPREPIEGATATTAAA